MKKLFLLLTTLMLSACGGPSSNSSSGGNDKQNFIYDTSDNLIDGKVSLLLVDMEKTLKAYETYSSKKEISNAEKNAYLYDIMKLNSKELCQIAYDTEKSGSFAYSFNIEKTLGSYMQNSECLDPTKARLLISFVPDNFGSDIKTVRLSNFEMKVKIEYKYNTGHGIRNISREKSGSGDILSDDFAKNDRKFKNSIAIGTLTNAIMEADEDYKRIEGDATLTFSGTLTAKF